MSNLAIDININAPELVGAIEHLCVALGKPVSLVASTRSKAGSLLRAAGSDRTRHSGTGTACCSTYRTGPAARTGTAR